MEKRRMTTLGLAILSVMAMAVVSVPLESITPFGRAASAEQPRLAANGGCLAGEEYDPLCDVNRDGKLDGLGVTGERGSMSLRHLGTLCRGGFSCPALCRACWF